MMSLCGTWLLSAFGALFAFIASTDVSVGVGGLDFISYALAGLAVLTYTAWLAVGALKWRPTNADQKADELHS
jgi:hypothetical protein